ncbi:uncharacterized protein LOC117598634 isoform X2 [Pangasianodon hypophthalmus]|uniref:uncharacterized protein LOC117598634 isoform X2 n=1 Tax=Pangasianodon hypophthalmus TaxID=310915 RepID=UPI0023078BDE|nr:uncharacterized protein LOC117598634 isoform X2 [Pangasianodon hypophthalmus]
MATANTNMAATNTNMATTNTNMATTNTNMATTNTNMATRDYENFCNCSHLCCLTLWKESPVSEHLALVFGSDWWLTVQPKTHSMFDLVPIFGTIQDRITFSVQQTSQVNKHLKEIRTGLHRSFHTKEQKFSLSDYGRRFSEGHIKDCRGMFNTFLISYCASVMEKHLFRILFFTGIMNVVLSVSLKYYLIQQGKTWNDAQAYCRANYDDLAEIKSDDNMIRLRSEVQRQRFNSKAWIGMYIDMNSWYWSLQNEPVGSTRMWATYWNQPNNAGGNELCGGIDPWGWLDAFCYTLLPIVCFDGEERHCSICHFGCSNYL